ncbi:MAG: hypothetical protein Kow0032_08340 [Methyloligellaceae bacterium]
MSNLQKPMRGALPGSASWRTCNPHRLHDGPAGMKGTPLLSPQCPPVRQLEWDANAGSGGWQVTRASNLGQAG